MVAVSSVCGAQWIFLLMVWVAAGLVHPPLLSLQLQQSSLECTLLHILCIRDPPAELDVDNWSKHSCSTICADWHDCKNVEQCVMGIYNLPASFGLPNTFSTLNINININLQRSSPEHDSKVSKLT